jgi:hypothetical protein
MAGPFPTPDIESPRAASMIVRMGVAVIASSPRARLPLALHR